MGGITSFLIELMQELAQRVPLPLFTVLGAMIEEILAPIPSPVIMTLSGSLAAASNQPISYLAFLALIGAIAKTFGSWVVYLVADKAEDFIISKFGRILGVSKDDTEGFGKYLNKGWRDDIVLFLLRALPIMPTAPVSVVCGLIKLNLRTYLVSTFFGTIVRNAFYLYFGYTSLHALETINEGFDSLETIGYIILAVLFGGLTLWFYKKRRSGQELSFFDRVTKILKIK